MIPQPLDLVIPVIAASLAAWLKDDKLPTWLNYVIVIIFFVLACLASVYAAGLSGDPSKDAYVIVGVCAAVFAALETAMNKASGVIPSPLGALAASNAEHKEFEAWKAANVPKRASASSVPPPGGSVIAPPTRVDLPVVPPKPPPDQPA